MTKLTALLIMAGMAYAHASTHAQTVTFSQRNITLGAAFKEIRKQTGYNYLWSARNVKSSQTIDVSLRAATLEEAIEQLLGTLPLTFQLEKQTILIKERPTTPFVRPPLANEASAGHLILAYETVSGRVVDSAGNALVGASVRVLNAEGKRTSRQTKSDHDGYFVLRNVPEDGMLEVTFVGYIQRRVNIAMQLGNIVLANAPGQLEEVEVIVNTGYQTLPKERATGSFSYIDNKTFNQQVGTTILERLETIGNGIVVDRTYGSEPVLMVRGLSTIEGPRDPLVVVDNFPYEGNINNINPNDVESVTILKDAAAASIWGARAGNGVIVIVTRKGKYNQPLSVNLNANVTIGAKPDLYRATQVSSSGFIDYEKFLYEKGYYDATINRTPSSGILSPVVELLILRDKAISDSERSSIDRQIDAYRTLDIRDDMTKYLYRNMVNQQYALNMQGGSGNFAWTASANYDDNTDVLHAAYNRVNLQYRQNFKPLPNLDVQTSLYFTQSQERSGAKKYGEGVDISNGFFPYTRIADNQGNPMGVHRNYRAAWTDTLFGGNMLDWKYYPLTDWHHHRQQGKTSDILINTGINYRVIPSLALDFKYQYEKQLREQISIEGVESWMSRYQINMWSQRKPDGTIQYGYPYGGKYQFSNMDLASHQFRGQLNFNKTFSEDHEIVAIAGGEVRMLNNKRHGGGMYGFDEELLTFNTNFNHTDRYPSLLGGSSQFSNLMPAPQHTTTHFLSMFGNAAYTYKQRYTLSTSARTDASNLFGLKTNDQWNPFYSLGLSWNIAKEHFYRSSILPNLRLRSTYGISGNINPAMVAVTTMQYVGGSTLFGAPSGMLQNYYNPELRWETAKQFNIGADFGTKNDVIQGSIEYFHKRGVDLFGNALLDYTAGVGNSITKNVASMKGNGLDIELNAKILDNAFRWQSRVNYSFYNDEIVDYLLNRTTGYSYVTRGGGIRQGRPAKVGTPVNAVASYPWGGLDAETGDPIGYLNGEKSKNYQAIYSNTTVDELVFHGSSIPTHFGNWINTFGYKNVEVHVGLNYKLGYFFRRETIQYAQMASQALGHSDFDKRWQKPGDEQRTHIPSVSYPMDTYRENVYQFSEALVERGDHVRLQYIQFNYSLNKQQHPFMPFRSTRIYLNANNLGLLWRANDKDIDPDLTHGLSHFSVPGAHSISLGLNVQF